LLAEVLILFVKTIKVFLSIERDCAKAKICDDSSKKCPLFYPIGKIAGKNWLEDNLL